MIGKKPLVLIYFFLLLIFGVWGKGLIGAKLYFGDSNGGGFWVWWEG